MKSPTLFFILIVFLISATIARAGDGCYFKPEAIFCNDASNAANAFKIFGFDMSRANLPHNQQILHDKYCTAINSSVYKITQVGQRLQIAMRGTKLNERLQIGTRGVVPVLSMHLSTPNPHDSPITQQDFDKPPGPICKCSVAPCDHRDYSCIPCSSCPPRIAQPVDHYVFVAEAYVTGNCKSELADYDYLIRGDLSSFGWK
ncbi:MAG: hypothetical protein WB290_13230 [Smithella sp.]